MYVMYVDLCTDMSCLVYSLYCTVVSLTRCTLGKLTALIKSSKIESHTLDFRPTSFIELTLFHFVFVIIIFQF